MVFVSGDKTDFLAELKQTLPNLHLRKWDGKVRESLHLDPPYLRPFTLGKESEEKTAFFKPFSKVFLLALCQALSP